MDYNMIFYIVFLVILSLRLLIGFSKGFTLSFYSFFTMLIYYVMFFLSINWVVSKLYTAHMPWLGAIFKNFLPDASHATNLKQVITLLLNKYIGSAHSSILANQDFMSLSNNLSLFILKIVYTILYFTVFYLIYKIITYIIRIIFIRNNKISWNKHRILGGVFGLLQGAMTVYFIIVFLGGALTITEDALKITSNNSLLTPVEKLNSNLNQNKMVKAANNVSYHNNKTNQTISLDHYLFNRVFSFEYRDKQIIVTKELNNAVEINNIYQHSEYRISKNISDIKGTEVQETFNVLSNSDLFMTALPLGIEVGSDYLDTDISIPRDQLYAINWQDEIQQLGNVSTVAINIINTSKVTDKNTDLKTVTFNGEQVSALFDALSQSKVADLAAYNALEPILNKSSSNVKAIITVPDNIVWEDEFQAIGLISGDVVNTNISLGTIESGNTDAIMTSLANLNYSDIEKSKIATQALINLFSGKSNIPGFNNFVVPSDITWNDVYDDQNQLVDQGELHHIFDAIKAISQTSDNIDFTKFSINDISKFSDDTINSIFESKVLTATVSNLLSKMDLGSTPLVIDDSVYDTNHIINKSELIALVEASKVVVTGLSCVDNTTCDNSGLDFSKAFSLSDTDLDTLLSSQIIHATLGSLIIDKGQGVITIPTSALTQINVDGQAKNIVNKDEIKNLFNAASVLGMTDINNMSFDVSIIKNLATQDDPTKLDQTKADQILNSKIIDASISKMLLDLSNDSSSKVVVPYEDVNGQAIIVDDGSQVISNDELNSILKAVLVLNLNDFSGFETLDINTISTNIDTLLNSAILHATLSNQLITLGSNDLVIPNKDEAGVPVRLTVGETNQQTEYVSKTEIKSIVNSLQVLGINDVSSFNGSIDLTKLYDSTNQDTVLQSASIQATISNKILGLGDSTILVPAVDSQNNPIRKTVDNTEYIDKSEIKAIINSMQILNITDINQFNGTIDLTNFYNETNQDILLNSASFQATISNKILGLGNATIIVPTVDSSDNPIRTVERNTEFIKKDEIKAIINGMQVLSITDINQFNGTIDLTNIYDNTNQDILLNSASFQATISKQLDDLGPNLVVPDQDINGNDLHKIVSNTDFINKSEIKAIINALHVLNITDINSYTGQFNLSNLSTDENQNILLASSSLQATISKKLLDLNDDVLIVPLYTQLGETDANRVQVQVGSTVYIKNNEIKAIMNAFIAMGYSNLDNFGSSIPSSQFFTQKDVLLQSASIQATLSNKLLNDTNGKLIIPNTVRINMTDVTYVEVNELDALLTSLEALNLTDFSNIDLNPSNVLNVNYDTLFNSSIMQATVSDNILSNALDETASVGSGSLIIPTYFREDIQVGVTNKKQIELSELKLLLSSLKVLNVSDFSGNIDPTIITSMNDSDLTTLVASGSMQVTMDNMIKGNKNIKDEIPSLAKEDVYNLVEITTRTEIIAFIKATSVLQSTDFTTVSIDLATISSLSTSDRNVVLDSMIVRNSLTGNLETIINMDPTYSVDNSFYENNDPSTFFTKTGINDILTHYHYI